MNLIEINMKLQAANNVHQVAVMFCVDEASEIESTQFALQGLCSAGCLSEYAQYQQFCGPPLPYRITYIKLIRFLICYIVLIFSEHEYKEFSDLKLL